MTELSIPKSTLISFDELFWKESQNDVPPAIVGSSE